MQYQLILHGGDHLIESNIQKTRQLVHFVHYHTLDHTSHTLNGIQHSTRALTIMYNISKIQSGAEASTQATDHKINEAVHPPKIPAISVYACMIECCNEYREMTHRGLHKAGQNSIL